MALYQWGRYYKSINEIPPHERPEDKIIEDDAKLDRWLEVYQRNMVRQLSNAGSNRPVMDDSDKFRRVPHWSGDGEDSRNRGHSGVRQGR